MCLLCGTNWVFVSQETAFSHDYILNTAVEQELQFLWSQLLCVFLLGVRPFLVVSILMPSKCTAL
jgi:hypothetical protein